jgi:mersacidin/lichenicidin family type 2 lantibiotic
MRKHIDIPRAWTDPEYRASLSDEERAALPENPVGISELDPELLQSAVGGGCSEGWICTVSGEITGFSCNPMHWF